MKEIEFNLNNYAKVKLTEKGMDVLLKEYGDQGLLPSFVSDKIVDGWYRDQLHSIIEIFGPHLGIGFNNPIEMGIVLEVEE